jgi:hypothetical protein
MTPGALGLHSATASVVARVVPTAGQLQRSVLPARPDRRGACGTVEEVPGVPRASLSPAPRHQRADAPPSDPARRREHRRRRTTAATVVNERVFRWWDYGCFGLLTAVTWAALAWVLPPWVGHVDWHQQPVLMGLLRVMLAYHLAGQQCRWWLVPVMRRPTPRPPQAGWHVAVATTFVPGAESLEMLEDTVKALVAMAYPHDTWVLDEGNDGRVKA